MEEAMSNRETIRKNFVIRLTEKLFAKILRNR